MVVKDRLDKIEQGLKQMEMDFPKMPDFENWDTKRLKKYVKDSIEDLNRDVPVHSYNDAVKYWDELLKRGVTTKENRDLILQAQKEYWNKIGDEKKNKC